MEFYKILKCGSRTLQTSKHQTQKHQTVQSSDCTKVRLVKMSDWYKWWTNLGLVLMSSWYNVGLVQTLDWYTHCTGTNIRLIQTPDCYKGWTDTNFGLVQTLD